MYVGAKDGASNVPFDPGFTETTFPPILKTLVSRRNQALGRLIVWAHDTPADELVLLANDADLGVRLAVARRGLNSVRRLHHPY